MQPFGHYLKSEREKRGVRLEEIASSTKIHIQNLNLMEKDRWKELPQEPFVRGFISAYARYLGLDNKETLKLFSQSQTSPENIAEENLEASASVTRPKSPSVEIPSTEKNISNKLKQISLNKTTQVRAGLLVVLFLVILGIVIARNGNKETPLETDSTPVAQTSPIPEMITPTVSGPVVDTGNPPTVALTSPTPVPTETQPSAPVSASANPTKSVDGAPQPPSAMVPTVSLQSVPQAPTSQPSAPIALSQSEITTPPVETAKTDLSKPEATQKETAPISGHEIEVQSKYRTWMKTVIDEEPPKESYLEAGAKISFQAKEKIKLVLGNSSGALVTHNGEESKGKKFSGTIRYYIFPSGSKFPQEKHKSEEKEDESIKEQEPISISIEENSKTKAQ